MSNFNVIIQPEAVVDLDEAHQFLEKQKPGLGFDLLTEITNTLEVLENNPFLFQKIYGDQRRAKIKRFNYNIIYLIREETVFILAIFHGRQNPDIHSD